MTSPLYTASIPVLQQMLKALSDVLKKAEEHAAQKNIDPDALLQARLFPDMFPLVRQVQIAADFAKGIASRLAGAEVPSWPDTQTSFADLQALITKALDHVGSFAPEQFAQSESREIVLRPGTPKEKKLTASAYLLHYGLPQFFFHVTTAYALLRHNGVEVGKRDYMGSYCACRGRSGQRFTARPDPGLASPAGTWRTTPPSRSPPWRRCRWPCPATGPAGR